jgi:hypothetical protein
VKALVAISSRFPRQGPHWRRTIGRAGDWRCAGICFEGGANCTAATPRRSFASFWMRSRPKCRRGLEIHLIGDNYGTHKTASDGVSSEASKS